MGEITGMLLTALPIQISFIQANYHGIVLAKGTVMHRKQSVELMQAFKASSEYVLILRLLIAVVQPPVLSDC